MKILLRFIMLLLAVWLLYFTIKRTDADILLALRSCAPLFFLSAIIVYGGVQLLGAWRWRLLLGVQGLSLPYWVALKLTLVGDFFSLVIPGSVSGDIVKVAIATRYHSGKAAELTLVDLIDRVVGLSGIFFAAFLSTLACLSKLRDSMDFSSAAAMPVLTGMITVNAGCVGAILLYLLFLSKKRWMKWGWLQPLIGFVTTHLPGKLQAILQRFDDALELYRPRQGVLLTALAISILIHFGCATTFYLLGKSLHEAHMSIPQYALTTQLANISGILPVAPGGIGLRDAVASTLYQLFQATPASVCGTLPIFNTIVLVFWALAGALLYIFSPTFNHMNIKIEHHETHTN